MTGNRDLWRVLRRVDRQQYVWALQRARLYVDYANKFKRNFGRECKSYHRYLHKAREQFEVAKRYRQPMMHNVTANQ